MKCAHHTHIYFCMECLQSLVQTLKGLEVFTLILPHNKKNAEKKILNNSYIYRTTSFPENQKTQRTDPGLGWGVQQSHCR